MVRKWVYCAVDIVVEMRAALWVNEWELQMAGETENERAAQ